jgi:hypothetical protein
MVGGIFGAAVGLYTVFTTRRFLSLPLSIIVSGVSFGFIMGCGSMIRTDEGIRYNILRDDEWKVVFE